MESRQPLIDLATTSKRPLEAAGIEFIGTPDDSPGIRLRSRR